jgi:hypothetical protein
VALALVFAAAFFWPVVAMHRPARTFDFLYLAWFVCLLALFVLAQLAERTTHGRRLSEARRGTVAN